MMFFTSSNTLIRVQLRVARSVVVMGCFGLLSIVGQSVEELECRPGRLLLMPGDGVDKQLIGEFIKKESCSVYREFSTFDGLCVVRFEEHRDLNELAIRYQKSGLFEWVEPDYLVRSTLSPNDTGFVSGRKWGLHNLGGAGGRFDSDIDAPEGWEKTTDASSVIVAVVDSGIRYTHEDLRENMWVNAGEIPGNGRDDDRNGIIDDVHGYDPFDNDGDPMDEDGHGTLVAGVIGASGNNGRGTVGVAWKIQLMACRFLTGEGDGSTGDAIACIQYAIVEGADIINASWGGNFRSRSLERAIRNAHSAGVAFVTAAGNEGSNNDIEPSYPASYSLDNIIAVAATDRADNLASSSSYGLRSIDLSAPGVNIYSTGHLTDRSYSSASGTSLAAPFVSGTLALMKAIFPNRSLDELIAGLLGSVDPVTSLRTRTVSGGRLNLNGALSAFVPLTIDPILVVVGRSDTESRLFLNVKGAPESQYRIESSTDLVSWTSSSTVRTDGSGFWESEFGIQEGVGRFFRVRR